MSILDLRLLNSPLPGYDGQITEQGGSLSAGQKQLLCLARAVLSPCKIVLIDEATANVDADTDRHLQVCYYHITHTVLINCIRNFVRTNLIFQEVIQQCLGDRTVLTIAHRVDTVLGCDRVLVMEAGNIVEAGHPNILLQDSASRFSKFVVNR